MFDDYDFLGFGIKNYKSFTQESALVGPFGKVHLITGQNNSGKSSLADIALKVLPGFTSGAGFSSSKYPFTNDDLPLGQAAIPDKPFVFSLCFKKEALIENAGIDARRNVGELEQLHRLLELPCVKRGTEGTCWIDLDIPNRPWSSSTVQRLPISKEQFDENEIGGNLHHLALLLANGASDFYTNLGSIFNRIVPWGAIPQAIKINAIREATSAESKTDAEISGGEGLINALLRLSNPKPSAQYISGEKWGRFISFVRDILDDGDAEVRIDADATMIQVKTGGTDFLALSELGTGIEELVIMAAVVACNERKLIIIEEPEIHLHPTLQAKIVRNLRLDGNGNRFLITTHSPSVINSRNVTITQVMKTSGYSSARNIIDVTSARDVLDDLGAHPADLLQANFIIWVEGPSDRIYVNYWLSVVAPELREGTHYSIMIYGGKLLNACSAGIEAEADELISLFRINTHFCVLMDSDRKAPRAHIASTKTRIRKECERMGCLSWITDGRTIENYIPANDLKRAIEEVYPGKKYRGKLDDPYICPLDGKFTGVKYKPDKILIARSVVEHEHELSEGLRKRIDKLVDHIHRAN